MANCKMIVTLTNGFHKVIRMSSDVAESFSEKYDKYCKNVFRDVVVEKLSGHELCLNEISNVKIINESTRKVQWSA